MANTYSQIYIQLVFAVKYRQALIHPSWEVRLYKYITGVITGKGQKLYSINGMPDHIHIFLSIKPDCSLSDLVREIKKRSTAFIKENGLSDSPFRWQEGFGAFSYSHSHISRVCRYVENQKSHHARKSFEQEYHEFLDKFQIPFNDAYIFDFPEGS